MLGNRSSRGRCSEIVLECDAELLALQWLFENMPWPHGKHEWDFLDLCFFLKKKKKIDSTRKSQFPLPFLTHQLSSKRGAKALVQLNWFLCCSIIRAFDKGSLPCSYYTRDSRAVPRQHWMSPAQPHRLDQRTQRVQLKMAQTNFSASLAIRCTSSYQACKPRSAMGPF